VAGLVGSACCAELQRTIVARSDEMVNTEERGHQLMPNRHGGEKRRLWLAPGQYEDLGPNGSGADGLRNPDRLHQLDDDNAKSFAARRNSVRTW
jgi:hypothetical protein